MLSWGNQYGAVDMNDPRGMMAWGAPVAYGGGAPAAAPVPVTAAAPAPLGMDTGTPLQFNQNVLPTKQENPGIAGAGKGGAGFWGNFSNIMDGLGSIGQLYMGLKSLGIAKEQLAFSKEAYQTNLANSTKSYNTALEDRIRSRYVTEGKSSAEADAYLAKNNL